MNRFDPRDPLVVSARRRIADVFGEDVFNASDASVIETPLDHVVSTSDPIDPVADLSVHRIAFFGWIVTVAREPVDQHSQNRLRNDWLHRAFKGSAHFFRHAVNSLMFWRGGEH